MTTIGAYEAKTNLSRILEEVEQGRSVTITKHGRAVAVLIPARASRRDPSDVIADLRAQRQHVRRGRSSVRSMIEEGRR